MFISYGCNELFSPSSNIPIPGQIIADDINENIRFQKILNSNISIDADSYFNEQNRQNKGGDLNDDLNEEEGEENIICDEIDLNAQDTQLNKLKTTSINENCKQFKQENINKDDNKIIIARRYGP
eukprot:523187_1